VSLGILLKELKAYNCNATAIFSAAPSLRHVPAWQCPATCRNRASCHVLAAVVTNALTDRCRARVSHRETLCCDAAEEGLQLDPAAGNPLLEL